MLNIEIYHLYRYLEYTKILSPVMLSVLKSWSDSMGCNTSVSVCRENEVNTNSTANVVGISVYTQTAHAAYRLSKKLRQRGKIVILGGPHFNSETTLLEGLNNCDVLVQSICEAQWKELLYAIKDKKITPQQAEASIIVDSENLFRYPHKMHVGGTVYKWYQIPVVPTSLGCPYDCEFCTPFMKGNYFIRDIDDIYNDISNIKKNLIGIIDANFGLNKKHTIELMKAIAPLKKQLWIQTTMERLIDKEYLDIIALGGVKWIGVGIESLSTKFRKHGNNNINEILHKIVDYANKKGIYIQGNFICGLDCDGPESFENIYNIYKTSNLKCIFMDILVPYPTTRLYGLFLNEERIIDNNWEHYDYRHLVYMPKKMSTEQLIDGYIALYKRLTSLNILFRKTKIILAINGFSIRSWAALLFNLGTLIDARAKHRIYKEHKLDAIGKAV